MLIANFADLHARGKDLEAFEAQWTAGLREAIARNARAIVIAGDIFDRPNVGDNYASTGAIARAVISPLIVEVPQDVPILAAVGNHDLASGAAVDALTLLEALPNAWVFRHAEWFEHLDGYDRVQILFFPWRWGAESTPFEDVTEALASLDGPLDSPSLLVGHVQVKGAALDNGMNSPGGSWTITQKELSSLPFDRIALGDYHRRQDLTGRGTYVGALRQLGFGQEGHPAGFELWNSGSGETEWVELGIAPRHRTVTLKSQLATLPEPEDGEILRIICDGFTPNLAEARRIEATGRARFEIDADADERVSSAACEESGRQLAAAMTPHKALDTWAKGQVAPPTPTDLSRLRALACNIIQA